MGIVMCNTSDRTYGSHKVFSSGQKRRKPEYYGILFGIVTHFDYQKSNAGTLNEL